MAVEASSQVDHAAQWMVVLIFVRVSPSTHHHNMRLAMPTNLLVWLKLQPARNSWVMATVRHPEITTPPFP